MPQNVELGRREQKKSYGELGLAGQAFGPHIEEFLPTVFHQTIGTSLTQFIKGLTQYGAHGFHGGFAVAMRAAFGF